MNFINWLLIYLNVGVAPWREEMRKEEGIGVKGALK